MRRFKRLDEDCIWGAVDAIGRWGYPRDIEPQEVTEGMWFAFGKDLFFWFVPITGYVPGAVAFHICKQGGTDVQREARRFLTGVEVIAETLGVKCLVGTFPKERQDLQEYCKRLGWTEDQTTGFYTRDLGV